DSRGGHVDVWVSTPSPAPLPLPPPPPSGTFLHGSRTPLTTRWWWPSSPAESVVVHPVWPRTVPSLHNLNSYSTLANHYLRWGSAADLDNYGDLISSGDLVSDGNLDDLVSAEELDDLVNDRRLDDLESDEELDDLVNYRRLDDPVSDEDLDDLMTDGNLHDLMSTGDSQSSLDPMSTGDLVIPGDLFSSGDIVNTGNLLSTEELFRSNGLAMPGDLASGEDLVDSGDLVIPGDLVSTNDLASLGRTKRKVVSSGGHYIVWSRSGTSPWSSAGYESVGDYKINHQREYGWNHRGKIGDGGSRKTFPPQPEPRRGRRAPRKKLSKSFKREIAQYAMVYGPQNAALHYEKSIGRRLRDRVVNKFVQRYQERRKRKRRRRRRLGQT
ncbi:hypothetical protein OTU49_007585, partial [Cherax quadricarinatus]